MKKIFVGILLLLSIMLIGCGETTTTKQLEIPNRITLASNETVNIIDLLDLDISGATYTIKSNSSDNLICSNDGSLTTVKAGTGYKVTLTITKDGETLVDKASINVIVKDYEIEGIEEEVTIYKNKESSFVLSIQELNNVEYSYSISTGSNFNVSINGNTLKVSGSGVETATLTITAKSGTVTKHKNIVLNSILKEDVVVELKEKEIAVYDNNRVIEAVVKKDGVVLENQPVEFYSSDESILTVDNNGVITKVSNTGIASIYAKTTYNENVYESDITKAVLFSRTSVKFNDNEAISLYGRMEALENTLTLDETNCGFELYFYGKKLDATFKQTRLKIRIVVDGEEERTIVTNDYTVNLATFSTEGIHKVYVAKGSSSERGKLVLESLSGALYYSKVEEKEYKFLFYGDSITVGHGVNADGTGDTVTNEDGTKTWAALVRDYYDANSQTIAKNGISVGAKIHCYELMYEIYNHYSYKNSSIYDMSKFVPDLIMINLGTNDATAVTYPGYGIASPNACGQDVTDGYITLITYLKTKYPNTKILCLYGMMGNIEKVDSAIKNAVDTLNETYDNSIYYLSMERVSCKGNGDHPDLKGQEEGASLVIKYIEENHLLDK